MALGEWAKSLGLEREEFIDIFELYIQTTGSDLQGLKRALHDGDANEAHRRAHSIKGASGNLGLNDICELATEIDNRARRGMLEGIEKAFQDLSERYEELIQAFKTSERDDPRLRSFHRE
jgi:HPt (histidine-containing phosphotransfer) domain-containing protein